MASFKYAISPLQPEVTRNAAASRLIMAAYLQLTLITSLHYLREEMNLQKALMHTCKIHYYTSIQHTHYTQNSLHIKI